MSTSGEAEASSRAPIDDQKVGLFTRWCGGTRKRAPAAKSPIRWLVRCCATNDAGDLGARHERGGKDGRRSLALAWDGDGDHWGRDNCRSNDLALGARWRATNERFPSAAICQQRTIQPGPTPDLRRLCTIV